MQFLIILLPLIALLLWVVKTRRYADGLFLITVAACILTFLKGFDLLGPHTDARWQGVVLISVSLLAMLGTAIAIKILSQRETLANIGSNRNAPSEPKQFDPPKGV
jgi:thiol:disulfide interchange protein